MWSVLTQLPSSSAYVGGAMFICWSIWINMSNYSSTLSSSIVGAFEITVVLNLVLSAVVGWMVLRIGAFESTGVAKVVKLAVAGWMVWAFKFVTVGALQ